MTAAPAAIDKRALSTTIAVHVLLILMLILLKYTVPAAVPQTQEQGMEVNLGTSDNGLGTSQPEEPDDPAEAASSTSRSSAAAATTVSDNVMQDDDEESPPVATNNTRHTTSNTVNTNVVRQGTTNNAPVSPKPQQQQHPKYALAGSQGRGGNGAVNAVPGGAEGNTFGNGDRGVPHGTPGAPNYTGTPGRGTGGMSWSLAGRKILAYPSAEAEFREGGTVIVRITVNRDGAIIGASVKSSTNASLNHLALSKIRAAHYDKNSNAPLEQFGTFTFNFVRSRQ